MYYRGLPRDVPWPGNQINDINEFREACYKQCHAQNPTDSGWYEKVNECGQQCKYALKAYEYMQGKNPCELRLQAPVFWFQRPSMSHESYVHAPEDDEEGLVIAESTPMSLADVYPKSDTVSKVWTWTDIFYMVVAVLLVLIVLMYIVYLLTTPFPRRRRR